MLQVQLSEAALEELAAFGRIAARHDWVPATSGNFSLRLDPHHIAITRSGVDKGALGPDDLVVVALDGAIPEGVSAEAPLHVARYRNDTAIGAVVHIHSVAATVLSRLCAKHGAMELEGYEMHKALPGFTTHESTLRLPIFANAQDTEELARTVEASIDRDGVPGYLLAGHGLYAWGETMDLARRHVEGLEFLLRCSLEERRLS